MTQEQNNKLIVFLSGPMRGVPREKALGWRKKAGKLLNKKIFTTLDAYRGRNRPRNKPDPILDPKMAVARDKQDILRSHILLVNDSYSPEQYPKTSMIGTAMEILFAYMNNIPVIVFGSARKENYWLNVHSHVRLDSLEEACSYINKLFSK